MSTFEQVEMVSEAPPSTSGAPRLLRRIARRPVAVGAIVVIVTIYGLGNLAPLIAPYGFQDADLEHIREAFVAQLLGMYHRRIAYPQSKVVELESRRAASGGGDGA